MPPGFSTEEFNALLGPRWKEGDPRDRVDPTRFARVVLAMKRIRRLAPDKEHSDQNYPYVSKAAVYDHVQEALAECGLHIRTKLNKAIEVSAELDLGATRSNKAKAATIEIDVSFAFAAPLDGPDAPMHWEQRPLAGHAGASSRRGTCGPWSGSTG